MRELPLIHRVRPMVQPRHSPRCVTETTCDRFSRSQKGRCVQMVFVRWARGSLQQSETHVSRPTGTVINTDWNTSRAHFSQAKPTRIICCTQILVDAPRREAIRGCFQVLKWLSGCLGVAPATVSEQSTWEPTQPATYFTIFEYII